MSVTEFLIFLLTLEDGFPRKFLYSALDCGDFYAFAFSSEKVDKSQGLIGVVYDVINKSNKFHYQERFADNAVMFLNGNEILSEVYNQPLGG